jgi:photosystem II stability/assembly factor-like uncharacterized protein
MSKHKTKIFIIFFAVTLALSGCTIQFNSSDNGVNSGGMYVSANKGDTWTQKVLIPSSSGKPRSIASLDVLALAMDPSDYKTLYLGSSGNGLFFTYDNGENWQIASTLGKVTVNAIAVDPVEKCTIYAAAENKVYKSIDCSRTWAQAYYDNDPAALVNAIAVDSYNNKNIFIGISRGDLLRSGDKGGSWQTVARFQDRVDKIVFSASDSRVIFAGTRGKGIFRSQDNGFNWVSLNEELSPLKLVNSFRDLAVSKAKPGFIILANNYSLIASVDNGNTWTRLDLIIPETGAVINSVFVGPKNADEIYYVTNTTFYRSLDGGKTWTTKKLPTPRAGWRLLMDPENANVIYMGVKTVKK